MKSQKMTKPSVAIVLAFVVSVGQALAFAPTGIQPTPNLDKRAGTTSGVQLSPTRQQAATKLQARIPFAEIDYDPITGAPSWIHSTQGFLSGPPELEIQRLGQVRLASDDAHGENKKALSVRNSASHLGGASRLVGLLPPRKYGKYGLHPIPLYQAFMRGMDGCATVCGDLRLPGV